MAAASFNEEFEKMLMTSEAGRPATLNNTGLRTLIENRSLNDYKKDGATKAKSAIKYFTKAGLIDKEKAPKYKDKSIKKNTYLPVKRIRKRKRRGFFYKLIKRIKGKDY